jgi:prepilin-type N-terminal cleavage/methylation domain-containing protein
LIAPAREDGFTMIELVMTMAILGIVLSGITGLFVAGVKSQSDQQARFDALTEIHVGLDKLKRDVHASCSAISTSSTAVTVDNPPCNGSNLITWCTQGSGSRYGLYRIVGSTCSGGTRYSDFLIGPTAFTYVAPNSPSGSYALARIRTDVTVDAKPGDNAGRFRVIDDVVFRNSARQ